MAYVAEPFDTVDDHAMRDFHIAMRDALLPILETIDESQMYQYDEFALMVKRGFTHIVRWVENQYGIGDARK